MKAVMAMEVLLFGAALAAILFFGLQASDNSTAVDFVRDVVLAAS